MKKSYYIPTLNGWRAISILLVLLYHGFWFHISPDSLEPNLEIWYIVKQGVHGVSIFFAISGFLISSRVLKEIEKNGFFNMRDFYIKRVFRILPPYLIYILALIFISFFYPLDLSSGELISSILFLRIYLNNHEMWYTAHFWSLCVEEHFYIILSFLYKYLKIKSNQIIYLVSLSIISVWTYLVFHNQNMELLKTVDHYAKVFVYMKYMFWGALFALSGNTIFLQKVKVYGKNKWLVDLSFVVLVLMIIFSFPLKHVILPFVISLVLYLIVHCSESLVHNILETKILSFVGKISYSLYLWQQFFFTMPNSKVNGLEFIQNKPYSFIFLFLFATFSHYYIEKPFIKLGRRFTQTHL